MASRTEAAASSSKDEIFGSGLKALGRNCGEAQPVRVRAFGGARSLVDGRVPFGGGTWWGLSVGAGPKA